MSTLTGHFRITQTAVVELASSRSGSPIALGIRWAGLPEAAVTRDIIDVLCLGHWADFGQVHHFMRRFDDQSPYEAYEAAVEWILTNAQTAAQQLSRRIASFFPDGIRGKRSDQITGRIVFQDVPWQTLGNAIHCLEDSFAIGHVVRSPSTNELNPGEIMEIRRYLGKDKEEHEEGDEQWWDNSNDRFSHSGRQAVEAVKALLRIVIDTAVHTREPQALEGWPAFCQQWLRASPKLSRTRDHIFELIDRHYTGIRVGDNNVITLSFDEEGLASALLAEPPNTTFQVFKRLDDHFNSDADDVAEIYLGKVRSSGGGQLTALKDNKPLIKILIKVMEDGWTSDGEQKCIDFLKSI